MSRSENLALRQLPAPGDLVLDHVSHFVADLDAAAGALEALGLAVTPASVHRVAGKPSGTSNRCAMLERGYIELIAGRPDLGLRLAAFGTPDAEAEHRRLGAHGFKPGELIALSRKTPRGLVRFKVARPDPKSMPEGRIQYVQHLTPQHLWQPRQVNRGLRLEGLFVVAPDPVAAAARWARFGGWIPRRTESGIRFDTARGWVLVARTFPWKTPRGPALAGYRLGCRHPQVLAARCRETGIAVKKLGARYVAMLPPALGGAWMFG